MRWLTTTFFLIALLSTVGCQERVVSRSGFYNYAESDWAARPREPQPTRHAVDRADDPSVSAADLPDDTVWAIAAAGFSGEQHRQSAEDARVQLTQRTGRGDWWVRQVDTGSVLYFGKYANPQDERAQRDLAFLQGLVDADELDTGVLLAPQFAPVRLAEPPAAAADATSHDLRDVRDPEAIYTLQVGIYDTPQHQRDAERAVQVYREDGRDAYYFHGPKRSTVTIGLFGAEAMTERVDARGVRYEVYSDLVLDLQKQFPYNLVNGRQLLVRRPEQEPVAQSSFLVRVPRGR